MEKLSGKTALVTGSTDGVGRLVARKLGQAGARVLVHGRISEGRSDDLARAQSFAEVTLRADAENSPEGTVNLASETGGKRDGLSGT
jgi:NAD(P)-dependent dehydrogenase (short-subunit alcohol dehydrogenase family)